MKRLTPSHGAMPPPGASLARYGSAPGSLFAAIAESVTRESAAPPPPVSRFCSAESSGLAPCESIGQPPLQRAYGGSGEIRVPPPPAHQMGLLRHSSSPAGLLSRIMADTHGMAATTGMGSYPHAGTDAMAHGHNSRLGSQWSFSRQDLPQISEMGMIPPDIGESIIAGGGYNSSSDGGTQSSPYLSRNFSVSSWDDTNNPIMFSPPSKKVKVDAPDDMVSGFSNIDSQFGLSKSSLEMFGVDDYLQQDSIACRIRAKRGCATHPRSIAERERRTRISKRLKKLQDLVPNMDNQTNTSEMLDIAVEYIKELQGQVEKLKHDQANCSCAGNQNC